MKSPLLTVATIALVAMGVVGCTNTGTVLGAVALDRDNRPIRDARVVLTPAGSSSAYTSQTDWGGNYKINVKEGEYLVAAEHPGLEVCEPGPLSVTVVGNQVHSLDLCLQEPAVAEVAPMPAPPPASGVVTGSETLPAQATDPAQLTAPNPVTDPAQLTVPDPVTDPAQLTVPDPVTDPAQLTVPDPVTDPAQLTVPDPITDPAQVKPE